MRSRLLFVLLASLMLVAAACNGDSDETEAGDRDETGSAASSDEGTADLPEGVAATVDGDEITIEEVERDVEATLASPAVKAQIEQQGDSRQVEEAVRAQSLSALLAFHILETGAEELGIEPTEEDVASARAELVEAAGGEEQLQSQLEASGLNDRQVEEQLRALATVNLVGARLLEEQGPAEQPPANGEQPSETQQQQQAAQQWLAERMAETEVVVDSRYGRWDPASGQVVPPSAGQAPPGGAPPPPDGGGQAPPPDGGGQAPSETNPS